MTIDFAKHLILNSCQYVVSSAQAVAINQTVIQKFAIDTPPVEATKHWLAYAPVPILDLPQDTLLNYIFVFSNLSFCYWNSPDYFYVWNGQKHMTSWGLAVALYQAFTESPHLFALHRLPTITNAELNLLLNKYATLPLFQERCNILRENAKVLCDTYNGSLSGLIVAGNRDANQILNLLYEHFPKFRDKAVYKGEQIYFMKKAQILISDVDRSFPAPLGNLGNAGMLTAAADYRLPQLLRHLGVLEYSPALVSLIDAETELEAGGEYEVEIRAATIWVNELLRKQLSDLHNKSYTAMEVNDLLWLSAKAKSGEMWPFHRVRTTNY